MSSVLVAEKTIDEADLHLLLLTDSIPEAVEHIRKHAIDAFGLYKAGTPGRSALLGEKGLRKKAS